MQDRVFGVVLFHRVEVGGTFEEVDALAGGVFGADGLAVDALGGEALGGWVSVGIAWGGGDWNEEDEGGVMSQSFRDGMMKDKVSGILLGIHTLSFSFARNSTNAACTSASPILPICSFRFPFDTMGWAGRGGGELGIFEMW